MERFDWSQPAARPKSARIEPGETITGTVTGLQLANNHSGEPTIRYAVDGVWRWANSRLHRAIWDRKPQPGDTITIERLPDDPPRDNGVTATNWRVELVRRDQADPDPAPQPAPVLPEW